jgi:N-acetylglucosaminyldiphosphoundecaprenol N-acetyl-beta-D-mannosaminyltransferase
MMRPAARRRAWLGGIPVDGVSRQQALAQMAGLVERGRGGVVFTPNVDHVVLAQDDGRFREAYAAADLSLVDGMPVLWGCRVLGFHVPEKISGSDLVRPLAALAAARGWRVFLLGAGEGVAKRAADILREENPGLQIVGTASPRVDLEGPASERDELRQDIRATRPDLLLVALGSPKGELFAHESRGALRPTVVVGVGAGLDFLVGAVRRAPRWMSASGLEWAYRLLQEPRRLWRRYLVRGPRFLPILLRAALGSRTRTTRPA